MPHQERPLSSRVTLLYGTRYRTRTDTESILSAIPLPLG
jgi:hypothetical protein